MVGKQRHQRVDHEGNLGKEPILEEAEPERVRADSDEDPVCEEDIPPVKLGGQLNPPSGKWRNTG